MPWARDRRGRSAPAGWRGYAIRRAAVRARGPARRRAGWRRGPRSGGRRRAAALPADRAAELSVILPTFTQDARDALAQQRLQPARFGLGATGQFGCHLLDPRCRPRLQHRAEVGHVAHRMDSRLGGDGGLGVGRGAQRLDQFLQHPRLGIAPLGQRAKAARVAPVGGDAQHFLMQSCRLFPKERQPPQQEHARGESGGGADDAGALQPLPETRRQEAPEQAADQPVFQMQLHHIARIAPIGQDGGAKLIRRTLASGLARHSPGRSPGRIGRARSSSSSGCQLGSPANVAWSIAKTGVSPTVAGRLHAPPALSRARPTTDCNSPDRRRPAPAPSPAPGPDRPVRASAARAVPRPRRPGRAQPHGRAHRLPRRRSAQRDRARPPGRCRRPAGRRSACPTPVPPSRAGGGSARSCGPARREPRLRVAGHRRNSGR